jgi:uncharacterized RDD family membrane protein YckC
VRFPPKIHAANRSPHRLVSGAQPSHLPGPFGKEAMSPRIKKLIGAIVMVVWIAVYAFLAMLLGIKILPHANGLTAFLYYAVAGLLWIIPIGLMLPWMNREPSKSK